MQVRSPPVQHTIHARHPSHQSNPFLVADIAVVLPLTFVVSVVPFKLVRGVWTARPTAEPGVGHT